MTNFLAMHRGRTVVGSDICFNSLNLANQFRSRFSINNACFVQMNLFDPFFKKHSFDVVVSNGVLHHTADAAAAFHSIQRLVKPGGYVLIGLYNWLGRLPTLWLRALIRSFGDFAGLSRQSHATASTMPGGGRRGSWTNTNIRTKPSTRWTRFLVGLPRTVLISFRRFPRSATPISRNEPRSSSRSRPDGIWIACPTELDLLLSGGVDGGLYIILLW